MTAREVPWRGRTGPFVLLVPDSVFVPTATSRLVAEALEVRPGEVVLDVGCGSGVLAVVAARLGAGRVYGCDISAEAVEAARLNARRLGVADRTEFRAGNLLEPMSDIRAEVLIGDVSGIPDAVAEVSAWFPSGRGGGPTGSELPMAMLESLGECLVPGGRLYLPTGTLQAEARVLDAARRIFGESNVEPLASREFPLPETVGRSKAFLDLVTGGWVTAGRLGSRYQWRVSVWRCVRP